MVHVTPYSEMQPVVTAAQPLVEATYSQLRVAELIQTACVNIERRIYFQLVARSIAFLAKLRQLIDLTTRLNKQQSIPAAVTNAATWHPPATQRRRPWRGCACMPVGTYPYLHAVGACNHVAVPGWHGKGLIEVPAAAIRVIRIYREAVYGGFWKSKYPYPGTRISRSASPICSFSQLNTRIYSLCKGAGAASSKFFLAKRGTDGSAVGRGCWRWRPTAGKQRQGKALASSRLAL
jgi:hypothetical protein